MDGSSFYQGEETEGKQILNHTPRRRLPHKICRLKGQKVAAAVGPNRFFAAYVHNNIFDFHLDTTAVEFGAEGLGQVDTFDFQTLQQPW